LVTIAVTGLRERFGIDHATIQVETLMGAEACGLRAAAVI
jgi:hypothetical protein